MAAAGPEPSGPLCDANQGGGRHGAALYREAESISTEAVEYVAATLTKLASRANSPMAVVVADEYAKEMMAGAAEGAYQRTAGM